MAGGEGENGGVGRKGDRGGRRYGRGWGIESRKELGMGD